MTCDRVRPCSEPDGRWLLTGTPRVNDEPCEKRLTEDDRPECDDDHGVADAEGADQPVAVARAEIHAGVFQHDGLRRGITGPGEAAVAPSVAPTASPVDVRLGELTGARATVIGRFPARSGCVIRV